MGASRWRDFLQYQNDFVRPSLLAWEFRQRFGDELTDALLRAGGLQVCPKAKRYPCGQGADRPYCSREIVEDPRRPGAFLALCRHVPSRCAPVCLTPEELVEYRASGERLGRVVRACMGLEGPFVATERYTSDTVQLGAVGDGRERHEVFLAIGESLGALLSERRLMHCRSVVLTPCADSISLEWRHRYAPGEHVVLASVADMLDCRAGEFVLLHSPLALSARTADEASRLLVDAKGQRPINEVEYEEILGRAPTFALFIDGSRPRPDGTYFASRRALDGSVVSVRLAQRDAMALIELVLLGCEL